MFIELVDSLRCVGAHEETWLVAGFDRLENRRIVEGTLGCPICRASYPVREGVAWIGAPMAPTLLHESAVMHDEAEVLRLAALLDLREPGTRARLGGALGGLAHALVAATQAELLLVDPPASVRSGDGVSIVRTGGRLPLADASMRAAALDERTAALLEGAVRVVRDGGRLVAPVAAPLPADVTELARDDRQWVGERTLRASAPVQLRLVKR